MIDQPARPELGAGDIVRRKRPGKYDSSINGRVVKVYWQPREYGRKAAWMAVVAWKLRHHRFGSETDEQRSAIRADALVKLQ